MAFEKANAIALMGSMEDVRKISEPVRSMGIIVSKNNYITLEELTSAIKSDPGIEYVFISDNGLRGIRDGKYTVPIQIKELRKDILIVIFFSAEKRNVDYLKWAAGLDVHHIYYVDDPIYSDREGNFNFNKILREIKDKKRIFTDEEIPDEENDPVPRSGKPRVIKVPVEREVIREVPVEVIKEVEVPVEVEKVIEKEVIRPIPVGIPVHLKQNPELSKNLIKEAITEMMGEHPQREQTVLTTPGVSTEPIIRRSSKRGVSLQKTYRNDVCVDGVSQKVIESSSIQSHISIGVFNLTPGAGATTLAVDLVEAITNVGYSAALVAYDGKRDLDYAKSIKATYFIPESNEYKRDVLIEARQRDFQFIVIDFGTPINLSPDGMVVSANNADMQELIRCRYKICLSFGNSWNIGKVNYFLNNPDIENNASYILAIPEINYAKRGLERLNVSLSDRNSKEIIEKLFRKVYLR
ncbi:MAG: hypothetical protein PHY15_06470 [Eubacteriales bacterium]|nr:hypothetical protein [Eubacteriales bacterium]